MIIKVNNFKDFVDFIIEDGFTIQKTKSKAPVVNMH